MEMRQILKVVADGSDDVAFHNLHMVNVVQEFDARRIYPFHHANAPDSVIAHIIFVVHFAVEQFHADGDAFIFRLRLHLV